MTDIQEQLTTNLGDFASLADAAEYSAYFRQLARVCEYLVNCYQDTLTQNHWEGVVIRQLASRLLNTVRSLELKYYSIEQGTRPLLIDVTESGFPNHIELSALEADIGNKMSQLRDLAGMPVLKQALADELLKGNTEPTEILRQLSLRAYFESLTQDSLFLTFNAGPLQYVPAPIAPGAPEPGRYRISFSCFDFATNRPYINFLTFEYRSSKGELKEGSPQFRELLKVLKQEGSRAPDIGILAMSIDEAIDEVRPKILKRLCVGPLYSRVLLENRQANPVDTREAYLQGLLRSSKREDDFVLLLTEEIVFSKRQEISKSIFSPNGRAREIFSITESDAECVERRASAVQHYYLMSHALLQQMQPTEAKHLSDFARAKKLAIDEMGEIHGL
ncbi:MAG: hypothetical protein U0136_10385 [Bdellovibrionota bacterium]